MARPLPPRLSPVTRQTMGASRLIPVEELQRQIEDMDRLGTWHLAQALALQNGFDKGVVDEDRYTVNKLNRHLQFAGALLGSINSRLSTYRFIKEVRDGQHGGRGDLEGYGLAGPGL